jgi:hypothetical protein
MNSGYIPDGYTRHDGFVKASEANEAGQRLWGDLEFTYRPAARSENVRHDAEVAIALRDEFKDPSCAEKAEKLACEFVAKKIVTWTMKDSFEQPVACTAATCARINAGLFHRVYSIIRGSQLSDVKPGQETPVESKEEMQKN